MELVEEVTSTGLEWHVKSAKDIIIKYVKMADYDRKYRPHQLFLQLNREMLSPQYHKIGKLVKGAVDNFVHRLASKLKEIDCKFDISAVYPTGSYSEGVKIGEPDEFDYIFELNTGQTLKHLKFIPARYPGYVHLNLQDCNDFTNWQECVKTLCHQHGSRNDPCKMCLRKAEREPLLAPELVQEKFRELLDVVVPTIDLPSNLFHSGFGRPNYSGYRKHGPASLLQFRFKHTDDTTEQEIIILLTIDITLAIKVPTPTALDIFGIDFHLKQTCCNKELQELIKHWIEHDPGIHVIPLYSNLLIAVGKPEKKLVWRVSCSLVERHIFNNLSDNSLPKVCLRVLKTLRDVYLTEGYRKKTVKRRRSRSANSRNVAESRIDNQTKKRSKSSSRENPWPVSRVRGKEKNASASNIDDNTLRLFLHDKEYTTMVSHEPIATRIHSESSEDDETSGSSENEIGLSAKLKSLEICKRNFQTQEISNLTDEKRPGEHYGLSPLLASMELKTYCLELIDKVTDLDDLSQLVFHVYEAVKVFYERAAKENTLIKNYFLKGAVLSPRSG